MFHQLVYFFFFLWSFQICAQIQSGEIEYAIEIEELPEVKPGENKDVAQKMYEVSRQYVNRMTAILKFDRSKALFELKEGMAIDQKPYYRFSKTLVGLDKVYFTELDSNYLSIQKEAFNAVYLIRDKIKGAGEWKISSASKMIDGFKVFKATTTEVTENRKGKFEHEVIAWFAPELSFSYGPVGYGGLPGLILELESKSIVPITYKIKTINLSNKALEIHALEGEEITPQGLNAMYKKVNSNLKH